MRTPETADPEWSKRQVKLVEAAEKVQESKAEKDV